MYRWRHIRSFIKICKGIVGTMQHESKKMVGMSLDGVSSMKNLAKLIKENVAQQALYVHCFAHANKLVFKDATALSPMIAYAQDFCENLYALFDVYPKRVILFESIQKDMEGDKSILRLKNLSKTIWTMRGVAFEVIIKRHNALRETLNKLAIDKTATPECCAKSRDLIKRVQNFENMFQIVCLRKFSSLLEMNSKLLQSYKITVEEASDNIERVQIRLQEMSSEKECEMIYEEVKKLAIIEKLITISYQNAKELNLQA